MSFYKSTRGAALKANASFQEQLEDSGSENESLHKASPPKRKYGRKANPKRKIPGSAESSSDGQSDHDLVGGAKQKYKLKRLSEHSHHTTSDIGAASKLQLTSTVQSSFITTPCRAIDLEENWNLDDINESVWALVDMAGMSVYEESRAEKVDSWQWWPAEVIDKIKNPPSLKVRLCGGLSEKTLVVTSPSNMNILRFLNDCNEVRFSELTVYRCSNHAASTPRKKLKLDNSYLGSIFKTAVDQAFELIDEGVPAPEIMMSHRLTVADEVRQRNFTGDSIFDDGADGSIDVDEDNLRWSPPPPDAKLEIPGELVFAKERKTHSVYWPAKVIDYVPPTRSSRNTKGRYRVLFLDNQEREIARDQFFSSFEEEGFRTCKLGKYDSVIVDDINDIDTNNVTDDFADVDHGRSPEPQDPLPSPEEFLQLSIREQFVYTKPILLSVLQNGYEPTQKNHARFIRGGNEREAIFKEASLRGSMDAHHVEEVSRYLKEWCFRGEQRGKLEPDTMHDGVSASTEEASLSVVPLTSTTIVDAHVSNETERAVGGNTVNIIAFENNILHTESTLVEPEPVNGEVDTQEKTQQPRSSDKDLSPPPTDDDTTLTAVPPSSSFLSTSIRSLSPLSSISSDTVSESGKERRRLTGCSEYEALSLRDKISYCENILLPEAIVQILLWRAGERFTTEVLPADQEQRLHVTGEELRTQTDWVFDLRRMREQSERIWAKKQAAKPQNKVEEVKKVPPAGSRQQRARRNTVTKRL